MVKDMQMRQLEALSNYRASPCLEWSKQLSRETKPFFVAQPLPNIRQSNNAEPPQRHKTNIIFDSMPLGHGPAIAGADGEGQAQDIRSYDPKLYVELHPMCQVNIGKSVGHGNTFPPPKHESEAVIEPDVYPGWGTGKKSTWAKAPIVSSLVKPIDRDVASPRPHISPTRRVTDHVAPPADSHVPLTADQLFKPKTNKSDKTKPKMFAVVGDTVIGGVIPKEPSTRASSRLDDIPSFSERSVLELHQPQRYTPGLAFAAATSLRSVKEKPSEHYERMLRPSPSLNTSFSTSSLRSSSVASKGFAPARYNHRLTLKDLLGQTSCDVSRAQSVMESCFGKRSRSSLRQEALYTPQPE